MRMTAFLKNFRFNILARIVLIAIILLLVVQTFNIERFVITPVLLIVLLIVTIGNLLHYIERLNRELTGFLESIRFSDFSQSFDLSGKGGAYEELKIAFNRIICDFKAIRKEKEANFFYLQNIIKQLEIGIFAFDENGDIELMNQASSRILSIQPIENITLLSDKFPQIEEALRTMKAGDKRLIKIFMEEDMFQLLLFSSEFVINDRRIKLISFKNIQEELDEKEMESWQKLIRVLTHEIMNSIAPISSLTSTTSLMVNDVYNQIANELPDNFDHSQIDDIKMALDTIHKRSDGLIHFVETYRNLTRIPKPNFKIFPLYSLMRSVAHLLEEDMKNAGVSYRLDMESKDIEITADEKLIEQVIINILKNGIHALSGKTQKNIWVKIYRNPAQKIMIEIKDNGQGILPEVVDKIFIPFFTTKPTGSGIGLSLSKQIMRLHGGTITVKSNPDVETVFTLVFQQ